MLTARWPNKGRARAHPSHTRLPSKKHSTHTVINGSIQKRTDPTVRSPTVTTSMQSPCQSVSEHSSSPQPATLALPSDTSIPSESLVRVIIHDPSNYNHFFTRSLPANLLSRSPYFDARINAFTRTDLRVINVVAEFEHFDIVANWLYTGTVCVRDGTPPDIFTLTMIIFLAETFDLPMLSTQIVSMLRRKVHSQTESPRPLPTYVEIYEKTNVGSAMRRFVVESYIHHDLSSNNPAVSLEDLPHTMVVDVLKYCQHTYTNASKIFDERLTKAAEDAKRSGEKRAASEEVERVKQFEERLEDVKKVMTHHCDTIVSGMTNELNAARDEAAQAKSAAATACTELKTVKETHRQSIEEIRTLNEERECKLAAAHMELETVKTMHTIHMQSIEAARKSSDENYNLLLTVMKDRNQEHVEAIAQMQEVTQKRETRLKRELAELQAFKEGCDLQDTRASSNADEVRELKVKLSEQIKLAQDSFRNEELMSKRLEELEAEMTKRKMLTKESQETVSLLSRRVEELQSELSKQVVLSTAAKENEENLLKQVDELQKANESLEDIAEQQSNQIEELNRVLANSEERDRAQVSRLERRLDEKSRAYKKRVEALERVNKELLDKLAIEEGREEEDTITVQGRT